MMMKLATDPHRPTQTFCSADFGRTKIVIPLRGIKMHYEQNDRYNIQNSEVRKYKH